MPYFSRRIFCSFNFKNVFNTFNPQIRLLYCSNNWHKPIFGRQMENAFNAYLLFFGENYSLWWQNFAMAQICFSFSFIPRITISQSRNSPQKNKRKMFKKREKCLKRITETPGTIAMFLLTSILTHPTKRTWKEGGRRWEREGRTILTDRRRGTKWNITCISNVSKKIMEDWGDGWL